MTAHRIQSSGLTKLLNVCRHAKAFYYDGKVPRSQKEQEVEVKAIGIELTLALEVSADAHSVDEIAALVFSAPGLECAFIQHTASLGKEPVAKVPGGAGAMTYGYPLRDTYRVFIHTGNAFTEETGPDLAAAVRAAFAKLNLPLPKGFPEQ